MVVDIGLQIVHLPTCCKEAALCRRHRAFTGTMVKNLRRAEDPEIGKDLSLAVCFSSPAGEPFLKSAAELVTKPAGQITPFSQPSLKNLQEGPCLLADPVLQTIERIDKEK